jgi:hypothetical protein
MRKGQKIFTLLHLASAVLMLAALAWLTVSLPYVAKAQQEYKQLCKQDGSKATDDNNPLSNTNEEKSESGSPLLAEYLHEAPVMENHFIILSTSHRCHPSALYLAYHPELLIPPPEV